MFLLVFMTAGFFQAAKSVGSPLAETEEITMQPVPKPVGMARTNTVRQFQCQRPVARAGQVFPQLLLVWCKNANATPTA